MGVEEREAVSLSWLIMQTLGGFCSGLVFGYALDHGLVSMPYTISTQMSFQNFTMMRMFLGASAASTFFILLFDLTGLKKRKVKDCMSVGIPLLGPCGANIIGGLLLGAGMALAGACPGTVWPQLARFRSSQQAAVIAGGLTGVIIFGYLHRVIKNKLPRFQETQPDFLADKPRLVTGVSVGTIAMTLGAVAAMDQLFPWKEQLGEIIGGDDKLAAGIWDPLYAGFLVGALQVPSMLLSGGYFGQSSGWVFWADRIAGVLDTNEEKNAPYLRKARFATAPYFQTVVSIGAIVGAYISAEYSQIPKDTLATADFSLERAYFGGLILLLGARTGGGCTSGHGLSGVASGSLGSMLSVACMFIGGGIASLLFPPNTLSSLPLK